MINHYIPHNQTIEIKNGKFTFPGAMDLEAPELSLQKELEAQGLTLDAEGRPLHPELTRVIGEHGLRLGRSGFWRNWGPNYTADPIAITTSTRKIATIRRKSNGKLALPGGFVDPSDLSAKTGAIRELREETSLSEDAPLLNVQTLYRGPVRDDRETIHAWPATTAVYMETDQEYPLKAQDDAIEGSACWRAEEEIAFDELHGSHEQLIRQAFAHYDATRRQDYRD